MRQKLRNRLGMLKNEPPQAVENILLESLRHAKRHEISLICRSLIETGLPRAITTAMRYLDQLDSSSLELLVRKDLDLTESVRSVIRGANLRPIPELISLIELRHEASLLNELVPMLSMDRGINAKPAAKAILQVTAYWLNQKSQSRPRKHAMGLIDDAVAEALDTFREHRCREILIAAALLCKSPGPKFRTMLEDEGNPVHFTLRSVAEEIDHPLVRGNILRWLDSPWLGRSITRWLYSLNGSDNWAEVLQDGHLLRLCSKRRALGRADKAMRCLPNRDVMSGLVDERQAFLANFISALGAPTPAQARTLGDLVSIGNPRTRLLALLRLQELRGPEADHAIHACINDQEPIIAGLATRESLNRDTRNLHGNLVQLERSPHESIVRFASPRLARMDIEHFFARWMTIPQAQRMVAAHRLFRVQRNKFLVGLRETLDGAEESSTLMAITMLRRMNLSVYFEASLVGLTFSERSKVAASAIMALGEGGVQHGLQAVRAALHHEDPRVQANAVEALMRMHAPETTDLVTFLTHSRHNRPRANAIVACYKARRGDGVHLLSEMLRDRDPLHRVSAIWAARRCRSREMSEELEQMADHDRLVEIRVRAGTALRSMLSLKS